jgi:hypothetical protein
MKEEPSFKAEPVEASTPSKASQPKSIQMEVCWHHMLLESRAKLWIDSWYCPAQAEDDKQKRFEFLLKQSELFAHFVETGHSAKEFKKGGATTALTPRKVRSWLSACASGLFDVRCTVWACRPASRATAGTAVPRKRRTKSSCGRRRRAPTSMSSGNRRPVCCCPEHMPRVRCAVLGDADG